MISNNTSNKQEILWIKAKFPKLLMLGIFIFLYFFTPTNKLLTSSMSDAYMGVGIFVISTLLALYLLEMKYSSHFIKFLHNYKYLQVPIASFLGTLPGCGGAIVVVTQYSKGFVSFGSVVATLSATMGDAAIVLLQSKPEMAMVLFVISFITAVISGYLIDFIRGPGFLPRAVLLETDLKIKDSKLMKIWLGIFAIAVLTYLATYLPYLREILEEKNIPKILGFFAATLSMIFWIIAPNHQNTHSTKVHEVVRKVFYESNFIITYVIFGYLLYEIPVMMFDIDIKAMFQTYDHYLPLFGILIGLIPGCGPQILVTTMYVNGVVPFSVQVANAITNDGDALFPAIAIAPKSALYATLYGIIPALIVSYAVHYWPT